MAEGRIVGQISFPTPPPIAQPLTCPYHDSRFLAAFIAVREGAKIASSTSAKYKTFAKQLRTFADSRGYVMLDQFRSSDIDVFYSTWKLGARAKGEALGTLRAFFPFWMNREWLTKNPVTADLKPPLGANRDGDKVPYTDEECRALWTPVITLGVIKWSNGRDVGVWSGEDVKEFIGWLYYTGLRISDVAFFHIDRLRGNEVFLRAKKNGGEVFAWIPDWLALRSPTKGYRFAATSIHDFGRSSE